MSAIVLHLAAIIAGVAILIGLVLFVSHVFVLMRGATIPTPAQPAPTGGAQQAAARVVTFFTGHYKLLGFVIVVVLCVWAFRGGCWKGTDNLADKTPPFDDLKSPLDKEKKGKKPAGAVSPTAEAEPKGTIVGGPKKVVTKVSADRINEWMLRSMTGTEGGWNLMRQQWSGSIDMQGYLPLPVGPIVQGASVEVWLKGKLPFEPGWRVIKQNNDLFHWCGREGKIVDRDTVALFLEVQPLAGPVLLHPLFGEKLGMNDLECSVSISKLPPEVGLWIGSYSTCSAESLQKPGPVPFKIDGEQVSWTMRLTIIPSEPVAPGAQELKETISPPGFYDTQRPMIWLMPENAVINESSPEATKASLDAGCVFSKELTPPFNKRESPTRDSFEVTSDEVRRTWQKEPGNEVEWAVVNFKPPTDSLVYWEMFFPVQ